MKFISENLSFPSFGGELQELSACFRISASQRVSQVAILELVCLVRFCDLAATKNILQEKKVTAPCTVTLVWGFGGSPHKLLG